jgi:hypothetical protein
MTLVMCAGIVERGQVVRAAVLDQSDIWVRHPVLKRLLALRNMLITSLSLSAEPDLCKSTLHPPEHRCWA